MRADLDTLRIHDLPADERAEVVQDLSRAQRRVEAIITALGQLASGQLARAEDRETIDVAGLLDRVARENARAGGAVDIEVEADDDLGTICGWPGGLRLAVDNLVRNAITHGRASRIVLAAPTDRLAACARPLRCQRRVMTWIPARQPSNSTAVEIEATTTKLGATPADVSLRSSIPSTMVHTHTTTPVGISEYGRRQPSESTQPARAPDTNGHAVSAIPPRSRPSSWLRRPMVANTIRQTTSVASAVRAGRAGSELPIGIGHHIQFQWHGGLFVTRGDSGLKLCGSTLEEGTDGVIAVGEPRVEPEVVENER